MRKIIIIPDSFKGTISSRDACDIMAKSAKRFFPHADVIPIPIADGGEGTVDAVLSAAGGMGAGVAAFFNGRLIRGIDAMLDLVQFDELLHDADVVFTGEGRLDSQSLMGKAVGGIAQRAKEAGVPVICVAGAVSNDIDGIYRSGITAAFSINQEPLPFSEAACKTRENLAGTMDNILRLLDWRSKE